MNKFGEFRYDDRIVETGTSAIDKMGANNGAIYWEMTPGTAPASANGMYIAEFLALNSTTAFIRIAFSGASSVTLTYADGKGNTGTGAYNATSGLSSGTSYQCKLYYTPTKMEFRIDNSSSAACTINGDVDWGQDPPVRAYWGIASGGSGTYTSTTYSRPTMDKYKYSDQYE